MYSYKILKFIRKVTYLNIIIIFTCAISSNLAFSQDSLEINLVAEYDLGWSNSEHITINDSLLVVSTGEPGLLLLNVSDPQTPQYVCILDSTEQTHKSLYINDFLVVLKDSSPIDWLRIGSIVDSSFVTYSNIIPGGLYPLIDDIDGYDSTLIVQSGMSVLSYDISDPFNPIETDAITPNPNSDVPISNIAASDGYLCLSTPNHLMFYSIVNNEFNHIVTRTIPSHVNDISFIHGETPYIAVAYSANHARIYSTDGDIVFDDFWSPSGSFNHASTFNNYLVLDRFNAIEIFDIFDINEPELINTITIQGSCVQTLGYDDNLFVIRKDATNTKDGVYTYDYLTSDIISEIEGRCRIRDFDIRYNELFVSLGESEPVLKINLDNNMMESTDDTMYLHSIFHDYAIGVNRRRLCKYIRNNNEFEIADTILFDQFNQMITTNGHITYTIDNINRLYRTICTNDGLQSNYIAHLTTLYRPPTLFQLMENGDLAITSSHVVTDQVIDFLRFDEDNNYYVAFEVQSPTYMTDLSATGNILYNLHHDGIQVYECYSDTILDLGTIEFLPYNNGTARCIESFDNIIALYNQWATYYEILIFEYDDELNIARYASIPFVGDFTHMKIFDNILIFSTESKIYVYEFEYEGIGSFNLVGPLNNISDYIMYNNIPLIWECAGNDVTYDVEIECRINDIDYNEIITCIRDTNYVYEIPIQSNNVDNLIMNWRILARNEVEQRYSEDIISYKYSISFIHSQNNEFNNIDLQLFPNPCNGTIMLSKLPLNVKSVSIYNILGQKITNKQLSVSLKTIPIIFPENIASGLYLISVEGDKNRLFKNITLIR